MSESKRELAKRTRDKRRERLQHKLQRSAFFSQVPDLLVSNVAELHLVALALKQRLAASGYALPDGRIDSAGVDTWRRLQDSMRNYLALCLEIRGGDGAGAKPILDLDELRDAE